MECPLAAIFNGLRQVDPLSTYFFIYYWDEWPGKIFKVRGDLDGARVAPAAPPISHLFFADDILVFCKANMYQVDNLKRILQVLKSFRVKGSITVSLLICFPRMFTLDLRKLLKKD